MEGQLTVRLTEQWWLCRAPMVGHSDSAKANSDLSYHLYSVETDALADGVLFGHCYKQWITQDPAVPTCAQIESPAEIS